MSALVSEKVTPSDKLGVLRSAPDGPPAQANKLLLTRVLPLSRRPFRPEINRYGPPRFKWPKRGLPRRPWSWSDNGQENESAHKTARGLTVKRIARLTSKGRCSDGHGLYLQINENGIKSWLLRYERDGKERYMGLARCTRSTCPKRVRVLPRRVSNCLIISTP